jgi:hypothetical protein
VSTRKPLYGWFVAEAISLTGTRISMIALPWFVLTTTGSETRTGLVALAELAPMVPASARGSSTRCSERSCSSASRRPSWAGSPR